MSERGKRETKSESARARERAREIHHALSRHSADARATVHVTVSRKKKERKSVDTTSGWFDSICPFPFFPAHLDVDDFAQAVVEREPPH